MVQIIYDQNAACLFQASFLGSRNPHPKKTYNSPPNVIEQSQWCKLMPKMHQNAFGGRPDPLGPGSLCTPPPPSRNGMGAYLKEGARGGAYFACSGRRPTSKGTEREGNGIPPTPKKKSK